MESSWCGGELVGGDEYDFLYGVEVYLCYAVAYFVGWECGYDVVEDFHDFVAVAEVDGAERVGEYHSGLVDGRAWPDCQSEVYEVGWVRVWCVVDFECYPCTVSIDAG